MQASQLEYFAEIIMKKGDLVKEAATGRLYLIRAVSAFTGRCWLYVEPVNEGIAKWNRAGKYNKVKR